MLFQAVQDRDRHWDRLGVRGITTRYTKNTFSFLAADTSDVLLLGLQTIDGIIRTRDSYIGSYILYNWIFILKKIIETPIEFF